MRIVPGQVREVEAPRIEDQGGQVDHGAARQGEAGGSASVRGARAGHEPTRREGSTQDVGGTSEGGRDSGWARDPPWGEVSTLLGLMEGPQEEAW